MHRAPQITVFVVSPRGPRLLGSPEVGRAALGAVPNIIITRIKEEIAMRGVYPIFRSSFIKKEPQMESCTQMIHLKIEDL